MSLFKQNEYFYGVKFFLTELNFLKGDTNIYFEYIIQIHTDNSFKIHDRNLQKLVTEIFKVKMNLGPETKL